MTERMVQGLLAFAAGWAVDPQGFRCRGGRRRRHVSRRFADVAERVSRFFMERDARRVVPELRVLLVLAAGEADTVAVAARLRVGTRAALDWLNMAADDGLVLERGCKRGAKGMPKVWRVAPAGAALLREALAAFNGQV